eukprot:Rmarinus@m.12984
MSRFQQRIERCLYGLQCKYIAECRQYHPSQEIKMRQAAHPAEYKRRCASGLSCRDGLNCKFYHPPPEIDGFLKMQEDSNSYRKLCGHGKNCRNGMSCTYRHEPGEIDFFIEQERSRRKEQAHETKSATSDGASDEAGSQGTRALARHVSEAPSSSLSSSSPGSRRGQVVPVVAREFLPASGTDLLNECCREDQDVSMRRRKLLELEYHIIQNPQKAVAMVLKDDALWRLASAMGKVQAVRDQDGVIAALGVIQAIIECYIEKDGEFSQLRKLLRQSGLSRCLTLVSSAWPTHTEVQRRIRSLIDVIEPTVNAMSHMDWRARVPARSSEPTSPGIREAAPTAREPQEFRFLLDLLTHDHEAIQMASGKLLVLLAQHGGDAMRTELDAAGVLDRVRRLASGTDQQSQEKGNESWRSGTLRTKRQAV